MLLLLLEVGAVIVIVVSWFEDLDMLLLLLLLLLLRIYCVWSLPLIVFFLSMTDVLPFVRGRRKVNRRCVFARDCEFIVSVRRTDATTGS